MLKAIIQIGDFQMEVRGKTPSKVFMALQTKQDLMCLVDQSAMFGEAEKGQKLLKEYIKPARAGELTIEALKNLNIEFEPGIIRCSDIIEE